MTSCYYVVSLSPCTTWSSTYIIRSCHYSSPFTLCSPSSLPYSFSHNVTDSVRILWACCLFLFYQIPRIITHVSCFIFDWSCLTWSVFLFPVFLSPTNNLATFLNLLLVCRFCWSKIQNSRGWPVILKRKIFSVIRLKEMPILSCYEKWFIPGTMTHFPCFFRDIDFLIYSGFLIQQHIILEGLQWAWRS